MAQKVTIGNAELWLGDCLEILPTLDKVDAVVTDPPYGIGVSKMTLGNGNTKIERGDTSWDNSPPDNRIFKICKAISNEQIFWGGNYFELGASRCWLVWDKCTGNNDYADCELAWTSIDSVVKKKTIPWVGANAKDTISRSHPTQKPVHLMEWAIQQCKKSPQTILDPFAGSGTTGVACANLGRKFIGIEIEEKYFNIAVERITAAQAQGRLFE